MADWREGDLAKVALDVDLLLTVPDVKELLMKRGVVSGQLSTVSVLPEHESLRAIRESRPTVSTRQWVSVGSKDHVLRATTRKGEAKREHTCEEERSERSGE